MNYAKISGTAQHNLNNFLYGTIMAPPVLESVVDDLCPTAGSYSQEYHETRSKINATKIKLVENVLHVEYDWKTNDLLEDLPQSHPLRKLEQALLVRIINIVYKGEYPIVVNTDLVVFVPEHYLDKVEQVIKN